MGSAGSIETVTKYTDEQDQSEVKDGKDVLSTTELFDQFRTMEHECKKQGYTPGETLAYLSALFEERLKNANDKDYAAELPEVPFVRDVLAGTVTQTDTAASKLQLDEMAAKLTENTCFIPNDVRILHIGQKKYYMQTKTILVDIRMYFHTLSNVIEIVPHILKVTHDVALPDETKSVVIRNITHTNEKALFIALPRIYLLFHALLSRVLKLKETGMLTRMVSNLNDFTGRVASKASVRNPSGRSINMINTSPSRGSSKTNSSILSPVAMTKAKPRTVAGSPMVSFSQDPTVQSAMDSIQTALKESELLEKMATVSEEGGGTPAQSESADHDQFSEKMNSPKNATDRKKKEEPIGKLMAAFICDNLKMDNSSTKRGTGEAKKTNMFLQKNMLTIVDEKEITKNILEYALHFEDANKSIKPLSESPDGVVPILAKSAHQVYVICKRDDLPAVEPLTTGSDDDAQSTATPGVTLPKEVPKKKPVVPAASEYSDSDDDSFYKNAKKKGRH